MWFVLSYFFIFKRKTGTKTSLIISFIGSAAFYILASCLSDIAIAIISGVQIELSDIKDMVIGYITYFQGGLIGLFLIILILFIAIKIYNKTYQTKIKKALVVCFEILASFIEICNFGRGFDSMLSGIAIIIAIIILLKIEGGSPIFTFSRFISLAVVAFGAYFSITAYDTLFALAGIFFIIFGLYSLITDRIPGRFYQKKRKRRINYTQEEKDAAAQEAGRKGEERVSNVLNKLEGYTIFDAYTFNKEHMYIRNNNGNFNEIDHLVIGPNGVFHIETKSYSGSITIIENGNWQLLSPFIL
jgi:membrane protein implicated in regulation of membrane protease activity